MFAPKGNTPLGLICAENSKEELTYLLNQEYNMLREKQDLKVSQAELLKAKEQEQKEAQEKAKQDESNN